MQQPSVEVELLGLARLLARRATVSVPVEGTVTVSALVQALSRELPALMKTVVGEDGALLGGYVFARGGRDLIQDPRERIRPGDRLQLISVEAGG